MKQTQGDAPVRTGAGGDGLIPGGGVWRHDGTLPLPVRFPMVVADEVAELTARFGTPQQRACDVQADDYIVSYRFGRNSDRRAEVVFAVEDAAGRLWVHRKHHYPNRLYRLPSGGVHWDEPVLDALLREIDEEMGITVEIARFLGLIHYRFWHEGQMAPFVSYVFHLRSRGDQPICRSDEDIAEFRAVPPADVRALSVALRGVGGARRGWGQWRALAHDLIYESLGRQSA